MTFLLAARCTVAIRSAELVRRVGRVTGYQGLAFEATGPDAYLGEICRIGSINPTASVPAEVIGFRENRVVLMAYGHVEGIRQGDEVYATGQSATIRVGPDLLGRVVDAFGVPVDGGAAAGGHQIRVAGNPPSATKRTRIDRVFETGVRSIDTLLTLGVGQRVGVFSGSGVGKSTLLGMIARRSSADVNVIALIGERGREVREFIEDQLGDALSRSVVIVATAEQPALVRMRAAQAATAIAEYFRSSGKHVAYFLDSLTRLAMAQREIGLAAGEPPTVRGYTPSVFSMLPQLLERLGTSEGAGSITGILTVLVEGDDLAEPVSDHARAILDGHIVLTRELAQQGHFPAIDVLKSTSRVARSLLGVAEKAVVADAISALAIHESSRDMVEFGAYKEGSNPELDRALKLHPGLMQFFRQSADDKAVSRAEAMSRLAALMDEKS